VKERIIYSRERGFNLDLISYYLSKLAMLTVLSAVQVTLLFVIVRLLCKPPGCDFGVFLLLLSLATAGVALGLAVSAFARSDDTAVAFIPITLIPQIILAGIIAPLEGFGKGLAQGFITVYWGMRGLIGLLPQGVAHAANVEQHSVAIAVLMIVLHIAVFIITALIVLYVRDARENVFGNAMIRWLQGARGKSVPGSRPPAQQSTRGAR
jgi:ABC transport system ATP-binding/permease protein